jgi:hypothetical protein
LAPAAVRTRAAATNTYHTRSKEKSSQEATADSGSFTVVTNKRSTRRSKSPTLPPSHTTDVPDVSHTTAVPNVDVSRMHDWICLL